MSTHHDSPRRRALALAVAAGATLVAMLGLATGQASAAYTSRIQGGTLQLTGDGASDSILLAPDPTTLTVVVNDTTTLTFDRSTFTALDVEAGGGDDTVRFLNAAQPLDNVTINGGNGNDTLLGANGAETILGGAGNDLVDGNIGNDTIQLGTGNDTVQWDPGDGSDSVDGQAGSDVLAFNGSNASENIALSANGAHVRLTRDIASITMDLAGIERANVRALGGTDTVTVNDLTGTDLKTADVDLTGFDGGADASADTVVENATDAADDVNVGSSGGNVVVSGLATQLQVSGNEAALDNVDVNTLGGADTIESGVGFSGPIPVTVDGGDGADRTTYIGTGGADQIGIARNGTAAVAVFTSTGILNNVGVENLDVQGLGGDDAITGQNGIGQLTQLTLDGGSGNDTLRGGDGNDILL